MANIARNEAVFMSLKSDPRSSAMITCFMTMERQTYSIGKQLILIEDDIVFGRFYKNLTLQEAMGVSEIYGRVYAKHKRIFLLSDLSQVTTFDAGARKYLVQWCKSIPLTAVAPFGLGSVQRVLVLLLMNAVKLVTNGLGVPYILAKDETEARTWIARQRHLFLERELAKNPPLANR